MAEALLCPYVDVGSRINRPEPIVISSTEDIIFSCNKNNKIVAITGNDSGADHALSTNIFPSNAPFLKIREAMDEYILTHAYDSQIASCILQTTYNSISSSPANAQIKENTHYQLTETYSPWAHLGLIASSDENPANSKTIYQLSTPGTSQSPWAVPAIFLFSTKKKTLIFDPDLWESTSRTGSDNVFKLLAKSNGVRTHFGIWATNNSNATILKPFTITINMTMQLTINFKAL